MAPPKGPFQEGRHSSLGSSELGEARVHVWMYQRPLLSAARASSVLQEPETRVFSFGGGQALHFFSEPILSSGQHQGGWVQVPVHWQ